MADDIFSRLFELFNQPGPVNWKLAEEVAHHLAGASDVVDPWSAEEIEQLVRVAEFRLEPETPFAVAPASGVQIVDGRTWVDLSLRRLTYLAEPITESVAAAYSAFAGGSGIGGSIAGLQIGGLAGGIAATNVASFEAGIPLVPSDALLVIGPAVERLAATGADAHQVRLWVAAHEVAHRALFAVPWMPEHLAALLGSAFTGMMPSADKLTELLSKDPSSMADPARMAALFDRPETPEEAELAAFLAVTGGYRRLVVERAMGELLIEDFLGRSDVARPGQVGAASPLPATHDLVPGGLAFCQDIERRFGRQAVDSLWDGPERLPTSSELTDSVGWAARVLLENDFTP